MTWRATPFRVEGLSSSLSATTPIDGRLTGRAGEGYTRGREDGMATAKIATLAIRTLAKPIATQIKHQAQSHQRFRGICISLAQFMHRIEMRLRSNLLASASASGEKTKVRPLNEAKAVSNGANALAEGFLFALAAALILGESYRGSRSRAKQRDRTEEGLEELSMVTRALAEKIGVNFDEIERRVKEMQEVQEAVRESEEGQDSIEESEPLSEEAQQAKALREARDRMEQDRDRLQHAVNVLLRLALRSGWIQGEDGLHLQSILDGTDEEREKRPSSSDKSPILSEIAKQRAQQTAKTTSQPKA